MILGKENKGRKMISGVQGLKIKPLAELKNDGIQKHTSIKSFSTVLSSQKKKQRIHLLQRLPKNQLSRTVQMQIRL